MNDLAKDRIDIVQVMMRCVCEEKLGGIGARSAIGHRHHASSVVPQDVNDLVLKHGPVDALPAFASPCRVSALHYKPFDVAVKLGARVGARCAQGQEVLCRSHAHTHTHIAPAQMSARGALVKTDQNAFTLAVFGVKSQNTSILISPKLVCRVTAIFKGEGERREGRKAGRKEWAKFMHADDPKRTRPAGRPPARM